MNRKPLTSSTLSSAGWDPSHGILEIEFRNHGLYQYEEVPEAVYLGLLGADSPGRFFRERIRSVYRYRRSTGGPLAWSGWLTPHS